MCIYLMVLDNYLLYLFSIQIIVYFLKVLFSKVNLKVITTYAGLLLQFRLSLITISYISI